MSADSSNRSFTQRLRAVLTPGQEWGVAVGVVVMVLALVGPWFLLEPLITPVLPYLPVSTNMKLAIVTAIITALGVGVVWAALAAYHKTFGDIGLGKVKLQHVAYAFVTLVAYIGVSLALQIMARTFFNLNVDEPQALGYQALDGAELLAAFVPLVLITPFAEEAIFRGFLYKGVRRKLPFWGAAVVVSALFGLVHGQWNVGLDVFAMSIASCYLVEKTASLWPSIFLHALKNGMAFILLFLYAG